MNAWIRRTTFYKECHLRSLNEKINFPQLGTAKIGLTRDEVGRSGLQLFPQKSTGDCDEMVDSDEWAGSGH